MSVVVIDCALNETSASALALLEGLLEASTIAKVTHDCKASSAALYSQRGNRF